MTAPFPGDADGVAPSTQTSGGFSYEPYTGGLTWVFPVPGGSWAAGGFGYKKPENDGGHYHDGVDIHAAEGSAIVSPVPGEVIAVRTGSTGGNTITIRGEDGLTYYFAHMQYPSHLSVGSRVTAGSQIGMVGNTGNTDVNHLHFSVKTASGVPVDPIGQLENSVASSSQTGSASTTQAMVPPSGGTLYEVDGVQYIAYDINGLNGASHTVVFEVSYGHVVSNLGEPIKMGKSEFDRLMKGATGGGMTDVFEGLPSGTTWEEILERTLMEMGIWGSDAMEDEQVLAVIAEAMMRPDMELVEFETRLRATGWWDSHTDLQRQWNDKSTAQQELEIVAAAAQLIGVWFTYTGQSLNLADYDSDGDGTVTVAELMENNPDLAEWSEKVASGQATQPMVVNQWIKSVAEEDPESPWSRTVRNEEIARGQFETDVENMAGEVMDLYQSYGIQIEWEDALRIGRRVEMNQTSMEELTMHVDEMATALYPSKPKGMTTRAWAQPYTQTMMSVLELPDTDLQDPLLQKALSSGATLGDFRKELRNDERWLKTKNARDEFNGVFSGLQQQMGF